MSGVDYSKWDKIEISSDEEEGRSGYGCNVTRFDSPQSITIGGKSGGVSVADLNLEQELKMESGYVSREKVISLDDYVFGGKSLCGKDYYWTQTDNGLSLVLDIDSEMQRNSKGFRVEVTESGVKIMYNFETLLLEEFEHGVNSCEDFIFWSIREVECLGKGKTKMLVLELEKKKLDASIRLWWRRIFKRGTETDISKFCRSTSSKVEEKNKKFMYAWDEAHRKFKNMVKSRQKTSV